MSSANIRSGDNLAIFPQARIREAEDIAVSGQQLNAAMELSKSIITGEGKSKGSLLRRCGYSSETTTRNPGQIIKKPTFQKLLDILLPDQLVLERHAELVGSRNERVAVSAVELAYKVKGHLKDNGPTAGAALLGIMLGQAKIDQPVAYVDVEVQPVNQEPTTLQNTE